MHSSENDSMHASPRCQSSENDNMHAPPWCQSSESDNMHAPLGTSLVRSITCMPHLGTSLVSMITCMPHPGASLVRMTMLKALLSSKLLTTLIVLSLIYKLSAYVSMPDYNIIVYKDLCMKYIIYIGLYIQVWYLYFICLQFCYLPSLTNFWCGY